MAQDASAGARWLPLLRDLTQRHAGWGIWKNADAALDGDGDIDSAAPRAAWPSIVDGVAAWAREHGLGGVAACEHVDGVLFVVAMHPTEPTFFELDVNARKYWRGATLFHAERLGPLFEMDERGFRRLRPGAEALILLTQNGTRWGGRPNPAGKRITARVPALVERDPQGVAAAARVFGLPVGAVERGVRTAVAGGWDQGAMLAAEAAMLVRAATDPKVALGRWRAKQVKRACPLLQGIFTYDRTIPGDAAAWFASVRAADPEHADA